MSDDAAYQRPRTFLGKQGTMAGMMRPGGRVSTLTGWPNISTKLAPRRDPLFTPKRWFERLRIAVTGVFWRTPGLESGLCAGWTSQQTSSQRAGACRMREWPTGSPAPLAGAFPSGGLIFWGLVPQILVSRPPCIWLWLCVDLSCFPKAGQKPAAGLGASLPLRSGGMGGPRVGLGLRI